MAVFLQDEKGETRGKISIAFVNAKNTAEREIEISSQDASDSLITEILNSRKLMVASSGEECKCIGVSGNLVVVDRKIRSINSDILNKGEIIIIHEKENS